MAAGIMVVEGAGIIAVGIIAVQITDGVVVAVTMYIKERRTTKISCP
jgi:hypothetical protein